MGEGPRGGKLMMGLRTREGEIVGKGPKENVPSSDPFLQPGPTCLWLPPSQLIETRIGWLGYSSDNLSTSPLNIPALIQSFGRPPHSQITTACYVFVVVVFNFLTHKAHYRVHKRAVAFFLQSGKNSCSSETSQSNKYTLIHVVTDKILTTITVLLFQ